MNPVVRILRNAVTSLHAAIYRLTGGRIGARMAGLDVLLLTTTGSRTGQPRTTPLGYLRDGDAYVIVASNGGADRHPAWYFNLVKRPHAHIRVGDRAIDVRADTLQGSDRERVWSRVVEAGPGYANYQRRAKREIPLVRLVPA